jgi:hypothetical protein
MLQDRGIRLTNPLLLEMSFDLWREQFNGRYLFFVDFSAFPFRGQRELAA